MTSTRSHAATLLLPRYIEHRERDVAVLRHSLDARDFVAIGRMGHNLRGNGASYGFPEIAVMGEALEAAARAKSVAGVVAQLRSLEQWLVHNGDAAVVGGTPPRSASGTRPRAAEPCVGDDREEH